MLKIPAARQPKKLKKKIQKKNCSSFVLNDVFFIGQTSHQTDPHTRRNQMCWYSMNCKCLLDIDFFKTASLIDWVHQHNQWNSPFRLGFLGLTNTEKNAGTSSMKRIQTEHAHLRNSEEKNNNFVFEDETRKRALDIVCILWCLNVRFTPKGRKMNLFTLI